MCGIVALINNQNFNNEEYFLDTIKHRGRVSNNFIKFEKNFLGHTLLNTTDKNLTLSSQPLISKETGNIVVFNGEIFNYLELKKNHLSNYNFTSNTDTEVVIKLFDKYGIDCLNYLVGDFAFVFYNKKKNLFYLARDRIGNKPLFYTFFKNTLVVSSESRSIRKFLKDKIQFKLDLGITASYLNLNHMPIRSDNFFEEIKQVKSASYIKVNSEAKIIEYTNYWNKTLECIQDINKKINFSENCEELISILKDSINIRSRCIYDNYSIALSGGIDSNSILNYLNSTNKKLSTYTFVDERDELEKKIIENIKKDSKFQNIEKNYFSYDDLDYNYLIEKLTIICDTPAPDMSFIFNLFINDHLSKIKHQAVLFDGGGGDEAFFGHQHHLIFFLSQLLSDRKFMKYFIYLSKYKNYNNKSLMFYLLKSIYHFLPISIKNEYKKHENKSNNVLKSNYRFLHFENYYSKEPIINSFYNTINNWVMPNVTSIFDKIAGYYGTVFRTPLTDHRLFEFSLRVNYESHFIHGTKSFLRNNPLINLNKEIVSRQSKSQFPGGQNEFIINNKKHILEYLEQSSEKTNLINFQDLLKKHKINRKNFDSGLLLRYYVFFKWYKNINNFIN